MLGPCKVLVVAWVLVVVAMSNVVFFFGDGESVKRIFFFCEGSLWTAWIRFDVM